MSDDARDRSTAVLDEDGASTAAPRRRRRGLRRFLTALGVLLTVLVVLVGGGLWYLTDRYAGNIDRVADVFTGLDEDTRPAPASPAAETGAEPVTLLLVGTDTRETAEAGVAEGGRSDAIMIARLSGDRQHAQLVSIPRDS
ncbi:hypothetical protein [Geodermatophilus sp. URMC 62]|uniref:hypothetical protein n=1 Tax=Geodermatophilus sp. URMC 62 TaxID=3423414 RepID=UPI00406C3A79